MGNNTILKLSMTNKKSQFIKLESRLELFELLDSSFCSVLHRVFCHRPRCHTMDHNE